MRRKQTKKGIEMKVFLKIVIATVSTVGVSFVSYGLWQVHKEEGLRKVFMEGFNAGKARYGVTSEE